MSLFSNAAALTQDIYKGMKHQVKGYGQKLDIMSESSKLTKEVNAGTKTIKEAKEALDTVQKSSFEKIYGEGAETMLNYAKQANKIIDDTVTNSTGLFDAVGNSVKELNKFNKTAKTEVTEALGISSLLAYNAGRAAVPVGGYFAVNGLGRAITGGSMSHNSNGEKDVAGIPFI